MNNEENPHFVEEEVLRLRERKHNGEYDKTLECLNNRVDQLYETQRYSRITNKDVGIDITGFLLLLTELGLERNSATDLREQHFITQCCYPDNNQRWNYEELRQVIWPLVKHIATFSGVIPLERQRELPAIHAQFLCEADFEYQPSSLTFTRLDWISYCFNTTNVINTNSTLYPFGNYEKHLDLSNDAASTVLHYKLLSNDDTIRSALYIRKFLQHRLTAYFIKHSTTNSVLYKAHFSSCMHYCFGITWWKNRKMLRVLQDRIWNKDSSVSQAEFEFRMAAIVSYVALYRQVRGGDDTEAEDEIGDLGNKWLQALLQVQLWSSDDPPSTFCQKKMLECISEEENNGFTLVSYVSAYLQCEKMFQAYHNNNLRDFEERLYKAKPRADAIKRISNSVIENAVEKGLLKQVQRHYHLRAYGGK